jgi:hypothetical protein
MLPSVRVSRFAGFLLKQAVEKKLNFALDIEQATAMMQSHDLEDCLRLIREKLALRFSGRKGQIKKDIFEKLVIEEIMATEGDLDAIKLRQAAVEKSDKEIALQEKAKVVSDFCSYLVATHFELRRYIRKVLDYYGEVCLSLEDKIRDANRREKAKNEIGVAVNESLNKAFLLCRQRLDTVCEKHSRIKQRV